MLNVYEKKNLDKLSVGDFSIFSKTISDSDVSLFAGISGDFGPLYLNREFGESTIYKSPLAHPMLVASLMGGAVYRLLKPDTYPIHRSFDVVKPFAVGDTITTRAEVVEKNNEKNQITLRLEAYNSAGELVLEGKSIEQMEIRK